MKRGTSARDGISGSSSDRKRPRNSEESTPRRVVFISGLPNDITEAEVVQLGLPFGRMNNLVLARKKNQALLEMSDLDSAQAMVEYYSERPPKLGQYSVVVRFSNYEELKTDDGPINAGAKVALKAADELLDRVDEPHSTLRIVIDNMIYPITIEVLHKIFSKFGQVLRIVTYMKNEQLHAFIEYNNAVVAAAAKTSLNGQNIYNGCCTLRVDFSNLSTLKVKYNNDKTYDYTNPNLPAGDGRTSDGEVGGYGTFSQSVSGRQDMMSSNTTIRDSFGGGFESRREDGLGLASDRNIMGAGNLYGMGPNVGGLNLSGLAGLGGLMGGVGGLLNADSLGLINGLLNSVSALTGVPGSVGNLAMMAGNLGGISGIGGGIGGLGGGIGGFGGLGGGIGGLGGGFGGGIGGGIGNIGGGMGSLGINNITGGSNDRAGWNDRRDVVGSRTRFDNGPQYRRDDRDRSDHKLDRDRYDSSRVPRDPDERDRREVARKNVNRPEHEHQTAGCILLVTNLNESKITPDKIFNLFGVYGNIERIKILFNKKDSALVQYADPRQAENAILNLNHVKWWGKTINVGPSKHTNIQLAKEEMPEAWLTKDFSESRLHRYLTPNSKNYRNIFPPSATLHLSNIGANVTEEKIVDLFCEFGRVRGFQFFSKDRKMALIQMSSVEEAIIALAELHDYELGPKSNLRVSFTNSVIRD